MHRQGATQTTEEVIVNLDQLIRWRNIIGDDIRRWTKHSILKGTSRSAQVLELFPFAGTGSGIEELGSNYEGTQNGDDNFQVRACNKRFATQDYINGSEDNYCDFLDISDNKDDKASESFSQDRSTILSAATDSDVSEYNNFGGNYEEETTWKFFFSATNYLKSLCVRVKAANTDTDSERNQSQCYFPRSALCNPKPSPLSYLENEHICGRPLGLRFDKKTGDLYIADAYLGLMKVGPEGGLATSLASEAEGVPLRFTNDLDIDDEGNVYFTDSSTKYQRRNFLQLIFSAEGSGRVLKYNPTTKETTVLARNLQFPNGVSLSKDGFFFVFCEGSIGRLTKYWLKGEKSGTSEVLAILPGFPDNVRTNKDGDFWVAIHCRRNLYTYFCAMHPKIRKFLLKFPISAKIQYLLHIGGWPRGVVVKYSPEGKLLQILEDSQGKVVKAVSEVEEKDGKLWIGSVLMPFVAVYNLE